MATGLLVLATACWEMRVPVQPFVGSADVPEYSNLHMWASHPDLQDESDTVPVADLSAAGSEATADVFFIYPTIYMKEASWNAPIADPRLRSDIQETTIRHQASVFNGSCRVFSPYYRQMTYYGFWGDEGHKQAALQLAFEDVWTAFRYYWEHDHHGRPLFIAGHSQGALMTKMLINRLAEEMPEVLPYIVAVYAVGWVFREGNMIALPVCDSPNQTNCYVSWNTYAWGHQPKGKYAGLTNPTVCVNPLIWTTDGVYASYESNQGALGPSFNRLYPEACDAQAVDGWLWIHKDNLPGAARLLKRFHRADYNLFWLNIRQNIALRLSAFQAP
jgi:hypothetical protein